MNQVKCPYCGYVVRDIHECFSSNDDETTTTECGECEKEFVIVKTVTIRYMVETNVEKT